MNEYEILRAEEEWQRAGSYSVRIQGMHRQYHIPLREEFDEHDGDGTKYIVVLDQGYPIATCRFYEIDETAVSVGRVIVLPEYRGKGMGRLVITEAEKWIRELGYQVIRVDSRTVAVGFYEKQGYTRMSDEVVQSGFFACIRMIKRLQ